MSVYVDNMQPVIRNKNWRYNKACHMVADSLSELHAMAKRLSLKRSWFQPGTPSLPHYDLTASKRQQAVRFGVIEITDEQLIEMLRERRKDKVK